MLTAFLRFALPALLAITMNLHSASEFVLIDFTSGPSPASWQIVNDDVMGGVSSSRFQATTNGAGIFRGEVSLENNGGFASVRLRPSVRDVTGHAAFVLRVRGDGRRYKFIVRTDVDFNGVNYQQTFATKKGEWEEHRLQFEEFVPTFRGRVQSGVPAFNPAKIESVGFLISDKQAGPFRLEIAWIKAVKPAGK